MIEFEVTGPCKLNLIKGKGGRGIEKEQVNKFKKQYDAELGKVGVYVFCISASGTFVPWYVGKATKSFSQECFTSHKLGKYNQTLRRIQIGLPVLFFISAPTRSGSPPAKVIGEVEIDLIDAARSINSKLLNVHHNKEKNWSIRGVMRTGRGKRNKSQIGLRKALGI